MFKYKAALIACSAVFTMSPVWAEQDADQARQLQALTARLEELNRRLDQMGAELQVQKTASAGSEVRLKELSNNREKIKELARDIDFYGQIDLGLEHIDNVKDAGNISRLSSGMGTSYVGVRGKEKITNTLNAIWNLEAGFAPDNGTSLQGGRLFGRQAYVGLEGSYGALTLGRQYNVRFLAWKELNPFGAGSHGLTTLDEGFTGTARADNAIRYVVPVGNFTLGANYSFGRDAVKGTSTVASNCPGETDDDNQCREWAGMVKYDGKGWGLSTAYERSYGGTEATYGGLTSADKTDSRFLLGGYFMVSDKRIGLGWVKRENEGLANPKSDLVWVAATVPVTKNFSIDGMLGQLKYENSADKANMIALRGVYSLSKQTQLYLTAEHMENSGDLALAATTSAPKVAPESSASQLSIISGIKFRF
ncbi:porin [Pseudomonas sp. PS1(2021)]|uniref:porin n=1 Tax=Pseudomonas sp. PS1(2021) TaxID=2866282 RepID=UPI001CEFF6AB|nr:porin [Pseudomonas sp. PS1(2021)]UCM29545.1 porin [Pseudomonas sp. PS1(2021)]